MDTQSVKATFIEVMREYATSGHNNVGFFTHDDEENIYTVTVIGKNPKERIAVTSLIARLVGNHIVIERDMNDKMLVDALLQAGVPREQIVLAYAGESIPEMDAIWQRT